MNCDHIWVTPFSTVPFALKAPEYGASVNGDYSELMYIAYTITLSVIVVILFLFLGPRCLDKW